MKKYVIILVFAIASFALLRAGVFQSAIFASDTTLTLKDRISDGLRQAQAFSPPPYFLYPDSFKAAVTTVWLDFTSWITGSGLTEKYDEFYQTGLNYHNMRINALIKAKKLLNTDELLSEKYLERSYLYARLSSDSFSAANEVFNNNLDVAEILAQGVKEGSEASVKFALSVTNPTTAKVADWLYLMSDYAVDRAITTRTEADKNLLVSLFVKGLFDGVPFDTLGGKTVSDYIRNRIGKNVFPILVELTKEEQWQWAVTKIIKESGVTLSTTTVEIILKDLSNLDQDPPSAPRGLSVR